MKFLPLSRPLIVIDNAPYRSNNTPAALHDTRPGFDWPTPVVIARAVTRGAIDIREHEVAVHGFGEGRNLSAMLWFVPASAPLRAVAGVLLSVASALHTSAGFGAFAPHTPVVTTRTNEQH